MSEGLIQALIFALIFIGFPIFEAIFRKNKKKVPPAEVSTEDRYPERDEMPSFESEEAPSSSEGLIPGEIWEELGTLIRGEAGTPAPLPVPEPEPSVRRHTGRRAAPLEQEASGGELDSQQATSGVDLASAMEAAEDAERAMAARTAIVHAGDNIPRLAAKVRRSNSRARRLIPRHMSGDALRKAILFYEILGPPKGMRDSEGGT